MCIELQAGMLPFGGVRVTRVAVFRICPPVFHFERVCDDDLCIAHSAYEHLVQRVEAAVEVAPTTTLTFFTSLMAEAVGADHYDDFFPPGHPYAVVPRRLVCVLYDVAGRAR